jgi:prepilin-type N-terminal cleavage/methylation domain-containing protein
VTPAAQRARRRRGFTLIEIAVALGILGVGMVACMQIFGGALRLEDRSAREARVALYARALMDELLTRAPDALKDGEFTGEPTAEGFQARTRIRDAGAEEGIEKRELDFESDIVLKYLEVEVGWSEGGSPKTYLVRSMRRAVADE